MLIITVLCSLPPKRFRLLVVAHRPCPQWRCCGTSNRICWHCKNWCFRRRQRQRPPRCLHRQRNLLPTCLPLPLTRSAPRPLPHHSARPCRRPHSLHRVHRLMGRLFLLLHAPHFVRGREPARTFWLKKKALSTRHTAPATHVSAQNSPHLVSTGNP